jgi:hypothetical protein
MRSKFTSIINNFSLKIVDNSLNNKNSYLKVKFDYMSLFIKFFLYNYINYIVNVQKLKIKFYFIINYFRTKVGLGYYNLYLKKKFKFSLLSIFNKFSVRKLINFKLQNK